MKELDDFTVERLQRIIRNADGVTSPTYFEVSPADIAALARIALAAKTAEPVAHLIQDASCFSGMVGHIHVELITKSGDVKNNGTVATLYAAPVLNSPAIPDGWIPCTERMPEIEEQYYLTFAGGIIEVGYFFDGYFADQHITHWMPLPAPPTTEK
ncbi:DUF551 domain-containing protein [Serratia fonticola]|uniref:DUF551 domain-containing protein n=1 Tax=Serratia fonticola TaxID=47917 RepID=UPI003AABCC98